MTSFREITIVSGGGETEQQTFATEEMRITYDDGSVINPFVVRDIERNSDRKKAEATTLCGQRRVADDGDGTVEYTVNAYIFRDTKNTIQQKKGVTGTFFNDLTQREAVDAYIKKDTVALSSDMNDVLINGEQKRIFDTQLTIVEGSQ